MSIVSEPPAPEPTTGPPSCAHCGAALAEDQEWCLECGSARTVIHSAPDWRVPVAIIGTVVLLVLAGFAIALANLSTQANRMTQTKSAAATAAARPTPTTSTSPTPTKPAQHPAAVIPGWATGLSGWTVVLAQRRFKAKADNVAREFQGTGVAAGVLNSSQHPTMVPGFWIVFSGRYPSQAAAAAAAAKLRAQGHPRARAREVAPPGGI